MTELRRLKIANLMYANVSGLFALYQNEKYRGSNFTWGWFVEHCVDTSDLWLKLHHTIRVNAESIELAQEMAKEIAEHLVRKQNPI